MTVTPYNPPHQYLVSSRTQAEVEYIVDVETMECGCPAALDFATTSPQSPCAHVEAAMAFHYRAKPPTALQGSSFGLLGLCQKTE